MSEFRIIAHRDEEETMALKDKKKYKYIYYKQRTNQIFTEIDKLPSNANDVSFVFSRCYSDGGAFVELGQSIIYYIHIYMYKCTMTCVEQ